MVQADLKVNQSNVIGEVVDDEAIIVNLDNGAYYSLRYDGALIWQLLEQEFSVENIIDYLDSLYPISDKSMISSEVKSLLAELQQEELVIAIDVDEQDSEMSPKFPELQVRANKTFRKPTLEKYTDMVDLLLLDPIHEVDEMAGWPHLPPK